MSPIFRHGGLRLYLLKLLDEAPRHGYDVIRLLQDRFMGVYSPSPGTIYPRLARLEEEGLVTHEEVDGKKIYRITDKGREEVNRRLDDLADLEEEITASVRDIAREVTEDVRETVRNLREELTWTARDMRREARERAASELGERVRRARDEARERARKGRDDARSAAGQAREDARRQSAGMKSRTHRESEGADSGAASKPGRPEREQARQAWSAGWDRWREWQDWLGSGGFAAWREEHGPHGRGGWSPQHGPEAPGQAWTEATQGGETSPGRETGPGREAGPGFRGRPGWGERGGPGWPGWRGFPGGPPGPPPWMRGRGGRRRPDAGLFADLERLAREFARDLRWAAWQTGAVNEGGLARARDILEDALNRIRDEVFGQPSSATGRDAAAAGSPKGSGEASTQESGQQPASPGSGEDGNPWSEATAGPEADDQGGAPRQ